MAAQPFDWLGYLTLAQELGGRTEEASLRSSLSRAYYYIYNLAMSRAKQNGFMLRPRESTHAQLWRLFSASPVTECTALAQIALRLKEKRERADYTPTYTRIQEEVPQVLADAQEFATRLARLERRHPDPASVRQ
jgi:uncharacterized protein (UPF0332 family)